MKEVETGHRKIIQDETKILLERKRTRERGDGREREGREKSEEDREGDTVYESTL